jgi:indole-3-glycerol phosphate synthase
MPPVSPNFEFSPPSGTLGALTEAAYRRSQDVAGALGALREIATERPAPPSLRRALAGDSSHGDPLRVIAEIKRASPSKGDIAPGLDAVVQARAYVDGGAAAISVLTEPERFGGSLEDLHRVAVAVAVPVLRKDFIVHPVQLWEARVRGAAAVLLIVRALPHDLLAALMREAAEARLEVLVEIRDLEELTRALDVGAEIIGVNNRNLETLVIDPATAPSVIPHIPTTCVAVAESGMQTPADAEAARRAGADALLVGSAITAAAEPEAAVAAFATLPRVSRGNASALSASR